MEDSFNILSDNEKQINEGQSSQPDIRVVNQRGYRLTFEDDQESQQDIVDDDIKVRIKRTQSVPIKQNHFQLNRPTSSINKNKVNNVQHQEVVQAFSFQSLSEDKQYNIFEKDRISIDCRLDKILILEEEEQNKYPVRNAIEKESLFQKIDYAMESIKLLKIQAHEMKSKLITYQNQWLKQLNKASYGFKSLIKKTVKRHQEEHQGFSKQRKILQKQIVSSEHLKWAQQLDKQRAKASELRRINQEIDAKLKLNQKLQHTKTIKEEQERIYSDQTFKQTINKLDQKLNEAKVEKEDALMQVIKYKTTIREREHQLQMRQEEQTHILQQIKVVKQHLQESVDRERKSQMQMKLLSQKYQLQHVRFSSESKKQNQELLKLRDLLKSSDQQLKQCQNFIISADKRLNSNEEQMRQNEKKHKQQEMKYFLKLQHFDQALVDIEEHLTQVVRDQQNSRNRQMQMEKMEIKAIELQRKEYELEQLENVLKNQYFMLEKKEEGLKAQYKRAIEVQNATKDKWYHRYYQLSDRKQPSIYSSSPHLVRQPASFQRQIPTSRQSLAEVPVRDRLSPGRQTLVKMRSQHTIRLNSPVRDNFTKKTKRLQLKSPESNRDYSITNRISHLRVQLDKQLKQLSFR